MRRKSGHSAGKLQTQSSPSLSEEEYILQGSSPAQEEQSNSFCSLLFAVVKGCSSAVLLKRLIHRSLLQDDWKEQEVIHSLLIKYMIKISFFSLSCLDISYADDARVY